MQIQPYTGQQKQMSGNFNNLEMTSKSKKTNETSVKKWWFSDPEFQRKKRVASYKVYGVEGKVKGTLKNGFRWLKSKCAKVVSWW